MLYLGFSQYEAGQDPVGDFIATGASARYPQLREEYPYPHCYLVCGTPDVGYHRSELFTEGLSYQWYPPGGENFQDGLIFSLDAPKTELAAMYRILDPWTRNIPKTNIRHIVKMLQGHVYVWPIIEKGAFSCTTFVLWALGMLNFPHRSPELIQHLRAHPKLFKEIQNGSSSQNNPTREAFRWTAY